MSFSVSAIAARWLHPTWNALENKHTNNLQKKRFVLHRIAINE